MEFFKQADIDWYAKNWAGKDYDPNNKEHIDAREKIKENLYSKVAYWAKEVASRAGFESNTRFSWHKQNGQGMPFQFREYLWSQIFHKDYSNIGIYFTVEVNAEEGALVFKLDCQREGKNALSEQQQTMFEKHRNDNEVKWSVYCLEKDSNWESLICETVDFIIKYGGNYYLAVNDITPQPSLSHGGLVQREFPTGIEKLPDIKREFKGIDINFNDEQARKNIIGNIGERLVIEFEQQKLKDYNLQHLGVTKVEDGKGYDIQSYDQNGEELFIEVKSTVGDANTPFFISANEVDFHKAHKGRSIIYRVYNLDVKTQQGEFFIISDWEAETISDTVVFRSAPIKKA